VGQYQIQVISEQLTEGVMLAATAFSILALTFCFTLSFTTMVDTQGLEKVEPRSSMTDRLMFPLKNKNDTKVTLPLNFWGVGLSAP